MYGKLRENKILHHLINTRDWSLIWLYTRLQLFWKQSLHRSEIGFHLSRAKMVSFRPLHPLSYRSVCYGYIDWYFMQRYCLVMFCRVWTESHCANGPALPLSGFPNASWLGNLSRFTLVWKDVLLFFLANLLFCADPGFAKTSPTTEDQRTKSNLSVGTEAKKKTNPLMQS